MNVVKNESRTTNSSLKSEVSTGKNAQTSKEAKSFSQSLSGNKFKTDITPAIKNIIATIESHTDQKSDAKKAEPLIEGSLTNQPTSTEKSKIISSDQTDLAHKKSHATLTGKKINTSLLEAAKISNTNINALIENNGEIFTTNHAGEIALKPVIVKDTVNVDDNALLTDDVLQRMQARIKLNDRANAYLELYNATGEEQLVLQTQITTYTGAIGSMALVGNMLAKDENPNNYSLSLDQFSLDILQGTHDTAKQFIDKPIYNLNRNSLQDADHAVWASKGMGEYFPGNIQFRDYKYHKNPELAENIYNTQGTINSLRMGQEFNTPGSVIKNIGKRPADFSADTNKYSQVNGQRFISVIEKDTGHIVAFWDKNIQLPEAENPLPLLPILFNQIENSIKIKPEQIDWHGNSGVNTNSTSEPGVSRDSLASTSIRTYLEADNPQIPANKKIENKSQFAISHPEQSRVLDTIRDEVRDEDLILWMYQK